MRLQDLLSEVDSALRRLDDGTASGHFLREHVRDPAFRPGPGDTLFLFTDGLPEASHDGEDYGMERIIRRAGECRGLSAMAWVEAFAEDLCAFLCGEPKPDDLALMAIRKV